MTVPAPCPISPRRSSVTSTGRSGPGSAPVSALLLLPLLALTSGCGGDGTATAEAGEARGLEAADFPVAVDAPALYTIGGFDAEGWEQFGRVGPLGFDQEGNLHLLDTQAMRVTVVDRSGALVRSFGRAGSGPGELGAPMGMAVFPDGRVVISDIGNRGFIVYGGEGTFDRVVPFDGLNFASTIVPLPSGDVLQSGGGIRMAMRGPGGATPPPPTTRSVQRFSLETGAPEVIHEAWLMPPADAPVGGSTTISGAGGQRITLAGLSPLRAFEPALHVQPLPDGRLAISDSVGYRIRLLRDGVEDGVLERPVAPTPVTPTIQEQERDRRRAELEARGSQSRIVVQGAGGGGPIDMSAMERDRIETMIFADEIPVIARMATDWNGRIWVERASGVPGEPGPTDVITADGQYLGTLPPDGFRIPTVFGPDGLVAYLTRDEYDAEVIEVRQLPEAWRGPLHTPE